MEAVIADDPPPFDSDPVWYFFECTDVDGGGPDNTFDSGWQTGVDGNVYSRDDYVTGLVYSFTVRTRDSSANQNETLPSPVASVTVGIGHDKWAPDPDPIVPPRTNPTMTWASPPQIVQIPASVGPYYNEMIATTAVDPVVAGYDGPYPVQYSFECQEDGSKSSGWINSAYYSVQVATQFDKYHFKVMARDTSPNYNPTNWSCICYAGDPLLCGCPGGP